jgi:hypothetical protein
MKTKNGVYPTSFTTRPSPDQDVNIVLNPPVHSKTLEICRAIKISHAFRVGERKGMEMIKARFALTSKEYAAEEKVMVASTTRSKVPMIRV